MPEGEDRHSASTAGSPKPQMILENFPRNELEFHERFMTEQACLDYWVSVRWPNGFVCPHCGHQKGWRLKGREEIECANPKCGKQTSPRAGTVLHNSPKPIRAWLTAMFHMSINKQAVSDLRLQRQLGFGCYETALRWLRELRRVLAASEESGKLGPVVEVDEAFLGGVEEGGKGPFVGKQLVVGIAERKGQGCGRARLRITKSRNSAEICGFINEFVTTGSRVMTDGHLAYTPLPEMGFIYDPRTTTKGIGGHYNQLRLEDRRTKVSVHLPQIHKVFSLVERIVLGAHQGSFSERHLQGYLDEYCFRFNRRHTKAPIGVFQQIVARAVASKCVPLWRSRGRTAPDTPTRQVTEDWKRLGKQIGGFAYLG